MIPERVLEKHLGILGINGSGKTYTAKGAAETLMDRGLRVCVVDPTGVWHGLRSSPNGKKAGYPIIVFGGPHADMQISGSHGDAIAEAIGTSSSSAIIDVSTMRGGERTRFFADFAETLRVKNSGPLNLFVDEAHLFMPQGRVADPNSANMLHAANNLISLGRSRGLRITIISQRPAKVHKDALTQVHSLIAMRLIAPQDRAAVEEWIEGQADPSEGKRIIASLPSLKTGEGWLWAPELSILERVKFPKIKTFDSSRTPEAADGKTPIVLAPINLDAIQGKLASIKQEKVANDPIALKKRIADLERQLAAAPAAEASITDKDLRQAKIDGYADGVSHTADEIQQRLEKAFAAFRSTIVIDDKKIAEWKRRAAKIPTPALPAKVTASNASSDELRESSAPSTDDGDDLTGPERRVLQALQFWRDVGQSSPTRYQVAGVAGYSATASTLTVILSSLMKKQRVQYPDRGTVALANSFGVSFSHKEAKSQLLSVLGGPEKTVINTLQNGDTLTRDQLCEAAGYSSTASTITVILSKLKGLDVVEYPSRGSVRMSEWAREILQ